MLYSWWVDATCGADFSEAQEHNHHGPHHQWRELIDDGDLHWCLGQGRVTW